MAFRLGRYLLEEKIGQGGMAEVYAAVLEGPRSFAEGSAAPAFARPCVVKRLRPELLQVPDQVGLFLEEARLGALLVHPCIVQVFDLGEADGQPFFAMERVDGVSVAGLLDRQQGAPLPRAVACAIIARAAEGLHHAHELAERGTGRPLHVVHRDVSPQNILLSTRGDVKVADFGIAKVDNAHRPKTRVGMTKGKLAYMAPEQARGETVDRRTDVYALGIVLWELLTSRPLFGDPQTRRSLRAKVPLPSSLSAAVPPELDALVARMLALEPKDRPASAQIVEEELDAWLKAHGPGARAQIARLVSEAVRSRSAASGADAESAESAPSPPSAPRPPTPTSPPTVSPDAPTRVRADHGAARFLDEPTEPAVRAAPQPRVAIAGGRAAVLLPASEQSDPRAPAPPRRLPQPGTRFLGRHDEMRALKQMLDDGARIVSLVGPAGVGKTRLAVRFADGDDVRAMHPGGVWLCEIGDESESTALDALARTLGVAVRPGQDNASRLRVVRHALAAMGRCLLVLDGADSITEHGSLHTSFLDVLVRGAPRARIVMTARRAFGAEREHVLEVPPLPVPPLTGGDPRASIHDDDRDGALELFLDRARLARSGHALPDAARAVVTDIVRKLDGVPLAIELAAAHAAQQTPQEILDRLETSSSSSVLRGAIESSVRMLDDLERRAFAQASVFCAPFDALAAEGVLDVMDDPDAEPDLAERVLERLRARSLLQRRARDASDAGPARFVLLAPLRARASQLLDELGLRVATEARHAGFYTAHGKLLRTRAEHGDARALLELAQEADNLAAVVDRIAARARLVRSGASVSSVSGAGAPRVSSAQATLALEAALALEPLLASRTSAHDLRILDQAVNLARGVVDDATLVRGLLARAEALRLAGRLDAAVADLAVVYDVATRTDDPRARGRCHLSMAQVQLARGRAEEARVLLERAAVECERAQDDATRARALAALGKVCRIAGDVPTAERFCKDAVAAAQHARDVRAEGRARVELASTYVAVPQRARHDDAARELDAAARALEESGDLRGLVQAHLTRAIVEVDRPRWSADEAEGAATRAHALAVRVGDRRAEGAALGWRGCARHLRGAAVDARRDYAAACEVLDELGDVGADLLAAFFTAAHGAAHAALGDVDDAARAIASARKRARDDRLMKQAIDVLEAVTVCFAMNAREQLSEAIRRAPEANEEARFAVRIAKQVAGA